MSEITLDHARFFYCAECKRQSYQLPCCGNGICTGGGCDDPMCSPTWEAAWKAINEGNAPPIDQEQKRLAEEQVAAFWKQP